MIRRLPRGDLRREAGIVRGVREGDKATVMAGMRELGYQPGEPSEWDSDLLLDYMHEVSWWLHAEEPLRLAPEDLWRGTDVLREDSTRHHFAQLRRMTLPPEALPLRRVEGLLFQTAARVSRVPIPSPVAKVPVLLVIRAGQTVCCLVTCCCLTPDAPTPSWWLVPRERDRPGGRAGMIAFVANQQPDALAKQSRAASSRRSACASSGQCSRPPRAAR